MHRLNVAHRLVYQSISGTVFKQHLDRDCSDLNIMMDADAIFPKGFHPRRRAMDSTGAKLAHPRRRRDTLPRVRYYYIDFGISSMFGPEDKDRCVIGLEGQDRTVPELSLLEPYNPFLVDVYILGNLFKNAFLDVSSIRHFPLSRFLMDFFHYKKYDNLEFLRFVIEDMMQPFPLARRNSEQILASFNNIIAQQSARSLRWRLKKRADGRIERILADIDSISYEGIFLAKHAVCERILT